MNDSNRVRNSKNFESNVARGKIAQVLASARAFVQDPSLANLQDRASLQEPSRPFTPLAFDDRMASQLNNIRSFPLNETSTIQPKKLSKKKPSLRGSEEFETRQNIDSNSSTNQSYEYLYQESDTRAIKSKATREEYKITEENIPLTTEISEIQQLKDFIITLDYELGLDFLKEKIEESILALKLKVDTILKKLRTNQDSISKEEVLETHDTIKEISVHIKDYSLDKESKISLYCPLLRFYLSTFDFSINPSRGEFNLSTFQGIEYISQCIYDISSSQQLLQSSKKQFEDGEGDQDQVSSAPSTNRSQHELIILETMIECVQCIWSRIESIIQASLSTITTNEAPSASQLLQVLQWPTEFHSLILRLMNSAAYALAIIRQFTTTEIDRKRLTHYGIISVIHKGIKIFRKNKFLLNYSQYISSVTCSSFSSSSNNHLKKDKTFKTLQTYYEKILHSLIQSIGIIRNFTLDKPSRALLQDGNTLVLLCDILSQYLNSSSEVAMNIARVLAKLSLYEGFRNQINHNKSYLTSIFAAIQHEADKCYAVMENAGENDDDDEEDENDDDQNDSKSNAWPQWYTWPMISRISFTLGNMTTSNEKNRSIIGFDLDSTSSMLLLLQVSASSLSRLHSQKQLKKHKEESRAPMSVFGFASNIGNHPYVSLDEPEEPEEDYEVDEAAEVELRDATIKLIRLLANLSIDNSVGIQVGSRVENLQILLDLLRICDESREQEEMLLNVIAALTNLTFYACQYIQTFDSSSTSNTSTESKAMARLERILVTFSGQLGFHLFHENNEIVLETIRVLGNLTRRRLVIDHLVLKKADAALYLLLQHEDTEIISVVSGVFINFTAQSNGRLSLLKCGNEELFEVFASIIRRLSLRDHAIVTLICQCLYNLLVSQEFKQQRIAYYDDGLRYISNTLQELQLITSEGDEKESNSKTSESYEIENKYSTFNQVSSALLSLIDQLL